jgi:hypothetical protein
MCIDRYVDKPLRRHGLMYRAVRAAGNTGWLEILYFAVMVLAVTPARIPLIPRRAIKTVRLGHEKDGSNTNACSRHQDYAIGAGTTSRTAALQAGPRWPCAFGSPGR